jgi:hypothetical protein
MNVAVKMPPATRPGMRSAVSANARRVIVTSAFENLGRSELAPSGKRCREWSTRTFLTNFRSLDPGTRSWVFRQATCGAQYEQNMEDITRAADMIAQGSKGWSDPADAPKAFKRTAFHAATANMLASPILADRSISGEVMPRQVTQRLMLNPIFVNWLAKAPQIRPEDASSYVRRLVESAKVYGDSQWMQDVNLYIG